MWNIKWWHKLTGQMSDYLCQGDYVFSSIDWSVCLFVCISNFTQKGINGLQWILWTVQGGKRNKLLDFGSDLDHDPALVEVCILRVLGICWLSVDIWWWRSITGWLLEWIRKLNFFIFKFTDWQKYILQRVSDPIALAEVCVLECLWLINREGAKVCENSQIS